MWLMAVLLVVLLPLSLLCGSVGLSVADVWHSIVGGDVSNQAAPLIVMHTRMPMAMTAVIAGAALAVSGLLLQTCFDNPLAGPSVLGISSGASLGVAVVLLAFPVLAAGSAGYYVGTVMGALAGAGVVMLLLILLAASLRSSLMLLITGILISYLASSAISLLNFFATQEGVHSFVIWGLGTFAAVTPGRLAVFAAVALPLIALSLLMVKPLNAMLLGDAYARSLGVRIRRTRSLLLGVSGALAAIVTAFCGPVGFVGLVVPHIARMAIGDADRRRLMPATILTGALLSLMCAIISVMPSSGIIPINAITPIVGVPVIIYVILTKSTNRL